MEKTEIAKLDKEIKEFNPKKEFNKYWIEEKIDQKAIDFSRKFGFQLCNYFYDRKDNKYKIGKGALSNSQIRNVFGEVKRIQMKLHGKTDKEQAWFENKSSFLLIQPKIAYASGRAVQKQKKSVLPIFRDVITEAANAVRSDKEGAFKRFNNFVDFFESILAYHKTFGGNN